MKNHHMTPTGAANPGLPTIVFDHDGHTHDIRTAQDANGQVGWVARDVCVALGITKPSRALERVSASDKGRTKLSTPGGHQDFVTVNKSGLFALAFVSRKPAARAFQHWVTSKVLPAIYEEGAYIQGEEQVLQATSTATLGEHQRALQVTVFQAVEMKVHRGLCGIEERAAQSTAFKLLNSGRRRSKSWKPKGKKGDI